MLQLSSGNVYNDAGETLEVHQDKLTALQEIVDEAKGEPMMVVFQFDHERDVLLEAFSQARLLDSNETLADWNAGKIEMLLVHPRSCGHGLNAQLSQCDLQVWFTPTTDAELYTQTVGRLNRPGNPKTVRVIRLIMQGTKDRASYLVVAARQRGEDATLESFENEY
jgi:SNF2 family DNA or RNA helicase